MVASAANHGEVYGDYSSDVYLRILGIPRQLGSRAETLNGVTSMIQPQLAERSSSGNWRKQPPDAGPRI
jgi:hypothetical protein